MDDARTRSFANDLGEIVACDCGGANLTLGPMTLHLDAEDLPLLAELLQAAQGFAAARPAPRGGKRGDHGALH